MERKSRTERLDQIAEILLKAEWPMSSGQIARASGMKLSPHFRDMLDDLKINGVIDNFRITLINGRVQYGWYHMHNEAVMVQLAMPF